MAHLTWPSPVPAGGDRHSCPGTKHMQKGGPGSSIPSDATASAPSPLRRRKRVVDDASSAHSGGDCDAEDSIPFPSGRLSSDESSNPLKLYCDAQQKFLRVEENSEVAKVKKARLQIMDPIASAFNKADFEGLSTALEKYCSPSVLFSLSDWKHEATGIADLFLWWSVMHEAHPDGVLTVLERRTCANIKMPEAFRVEFVCQFSGTRVTSRSLVSIFEAVLVEASPLSHPVNHDRISSLIIRQLPASGAGDEETPICTYILEMVMSFDPLGLADGWTISTLASSAP